MVLSVEMVEKVKSERAKVEFLMKMQVKCKVYTGLDRECKNNLT